MNLRFLSLAGVCAIGLLAGCDDQDAPVRSGYVSYVSLEWAPGRSLLLSSGDASNEGLYSNHFDQANPYLELHRNWARVRYEVQENKGGSHEATICVPLSGLGAFNWKPEEAE